jgi:two-component system chemotaxis response regulator CheB
MNILIADDSGPFRMMLGRILAAEPMFTAIWAAEDGRQAVEMAEQLRPDIILMDLEMPRLDGFGAVDEIMHSAAACPIVVLSSLISDEERVHAARCFEVGAVEVLGKPRQNSMAAFRTRLMSVIRTMARARVVRRKRAGDTAQSPAREPYAARLAPLLPSGMASPAPPPPRPAAAPSPVPGPRGAGASPRVLAIGSSTGGPPVLRELLASMPAPFPMPVVIAQHILAGFDAGLAGWLRGTGHDVVLVKDTMPLVAGRVYVAPGDAHMVIEGDHVRLLAVADGDMVPSADKLLSSAARQFGEAAVGVVLTGMGRDGAKGLAAIRQSGGRTITQRGDTCVVNGMPEACREIGASQEDLPPALIAQVLAGLARQLRSAA